MIIIFWGVWYLYQSSWYWKFANKGSRWLSYLQNIDTQIDMCCIWIIVFNLSQNNK